MVRCKEGEYPHLPPTNSGQIHSGVQAAILFLQEAVWKDPRLLHIQVPADLTAEEVNQDLTPEDPHRARPDHQAAVVVAAAVAVVVAAAEEDNPSKL